MNLIDDMMEDCIIMDKVTSNDGEGGKVESWVDGAKIQAAITNDTSTLAKIAEHEGVTSTFKITTHKNVVLKFPDVIKRVRDGETFRVVSNGSDVISPNFFSFDVSRVSAEKWRLS